MALTEQASKSSPSTYSSRTSLDSKALGDGRDQHIPVVVLGHLADRLDTNGSGRHALDKPDQSEPSRYGFDRSQG
jgi:hypothetical protein